MYESYDKNKNKNMIRIHRHRFLIRGSFFCLYNYMLVHVALTVFYIFIYLLPHFYRYCLTPMWVTCLTSNVYILLFMQKFSIFYESLEVQFKRLIWKWAQRILQRSCLKATTGVLSDVLTESHSWSIITETSSVQFMYL